MAHALQVSSWPVCQDAGGGDEGHAKTRQCLEKAVPMIQNGEVNQDNAANRPGADKVISELAGHAREFAVTQDAKRGHGQNDPKCAQHDG